MSRLTILLLSLFLTATHFGCGAPRHNGYKHSMPWKKAKRVKFDGEYSAEIEGSLSYAKRRRARWYKIALPGDGNLDIRVTTDFHEPDRDEFDLAFELLDSEYRPLAHADQEDDDAGEKRKERLVKGLSEGTYYLHIYLQGREDSAEFSADIQYQRGAAVSGSQMAFVPLPPPLALVPVIDDSPDSIPPPRKEPVKKPTRTKTVKKPKPPAGPRVRGRILRAVKSGSATRLTINVGANSGVAVGWRGYVVDKSGKSIARGRIKIIRVSPSECVGDVGASRDAVLAAKRVVLRP